MREEIKRWWREAVAETSKPFPGTCALCSGPGTNYPVDAICSAAIFVCACCSGPNCKHRSQRQQQMDRALAAMDQGGDWKRACNAAGLEASKSNAGMIAFWVANRRCETTEEYAARCCPLRPARMLKVA